MAKKSTDRVVEPYRNPLEFAQAYLGVLDLRRELNRQKYGTRDPRCDVPEEEVAPLDDGPLYTEVAGRLDDAERTHEARKEVTRAMGIKHPLNELCQQYGFGDADRRVLEVMLAEAADLRYPPGKKELTAGWIARFLARWDGRKAQEYIACFVPQSPLVQSQAVELEVSGLHGTPFGDWIVRLGRGLFPYLIGFEERRWRAIFDDSPEDCAVRPVDITKYLVKTGLVLDDDANAAITGIWRDIGQIDTLRDNWGFAKASRLFEGFGVLLHGPEGTGRRLTARALAEALGRGTTTVDARDVLRPGMSYDVLRRAFEDCSPRHFLLHFTNAMSC